MRLSGNRRTRGKTTPRSLGLQNYSRADLETVVAACRRPQVQVVGLARIADDVTPELERAAIDSVTVLGAFQASPALRRAPSAMNGGRSGMAGLKGGNGAAGAPRGKAVQAVPIIVFHRDRDHTVQQSNGARIVQQALDAYGAQLQADGDLPVSTQSGVSPGGRRFSRSVHADTQGQTWIESWIVHGAGHAWSGGNPSGSYTDQAGPDASAEMIRFFMALPRTDSE